MLFLIDEMSYIIIFEVVEDELAEGGFVKTSM